MERLIKYIKQIKRKEQALQKGVKPMIDKSAIDDLAFERARLRHRKKHGHFTSKDTLSAIQNSYNVFHSSEFLSVSILSDFDLVVYEYDDLKSRGVEDDFDPEFYINSYKKLECQLDEWIDDYGESFWIINFFDYSDKNELLDEYRDVEIVSHFIDKNPRFYY